MKDYFYDKALNKEKGDHTSNEKVSFNLNAQIYSQNKTPCVYTLRCQTNCKLARMELCDHRHRRLEECQYKKFTLKISCTNTFHDNFIQSLTVRAQTLGFNPNQKIFLFESNCKEIQTQDFKLKLNKEIKFQR